MPNDTFDIRPGETVRVRRREGGSWPSRVLDVQPRENGPPSVLLTDIDGPAGLRILRGQPGAWWVWEVER